MIGLALVVALTCGANATQLDLDQCASAALVTANAREAAAYRTARSQHPGDVTLQQSERAWHAMRAATCRYAALLVEGGSMYPMMTDECAASSASQRVRAIALYTGRADSAASIPSPQSVAEHERVYGLLDVLLTADERARLVDSENAWLRYRALACSRASARCATELTRARTQELKDTWIAERFW